MLVSDAAASSGLRDQMPAINRRKLSLFRSNGDPMRLLTADNVKLGFIGLGNMGKRIAQRLLDHRYQLFVCDSDIAKADAIAAQGGVVAKNILELAGSADVILSC